MIFEVLQPLLIGARNVETAHLIAEILDQENLPYQLLTAEDNKAEAEKIKKAALVRAPLKTWIDKRRRENRSQDPLASFFSPSVPPHGGANDRQ